MNTTTNAPATTTHLETSLKTFVVLSATALTLVLAAAAHGHTVNTFMWIRGALLPIIAIALYRLNTTGTRRAHDKLRTLSLIMPIAIIAVDLIPGVCPLWYTALQTLCMLPVITAAVLIRRTTPATTR